ncbi:MAG: hypothetical protein PCFJNLEI_00893 [Verrucomicrobiae bacterium]|nr:hypothetical protein [Verrucomicrobiae bacterium]
MPILNKAHELLARPGGQSAALRIQPGIGAEGFRIDAAGITGNDERGLLYGVGKHLRDPSWRGTSVPDRALRPVFFASHFHNFYHDAPIEKVCRYIEELALWGCNLLMVWFDMHHYSGIHDPAAQAMIKRLRAMLETAESVGMQSGLAMLANEAYANSPLEQRADFRWKENGYKSDIGAYGVEICPNKPGGMELICRYRQEVLDAFRGLNIGLFSLGAYDQGGCTCAQCKPWGAHGYLQTIAMVAPLVKQSFPNAKFMLVTWYLDKNIDGEWERLTKAFANGAPPYVDYVLADNAGSFPEYPLKHGVPGGLPVISFPEISMVGMWPWGAFGANPRIAHWQQYWDSLDHRIAAAVPYSEGIYEDLNKVLQLQHGWDRRRPLRDIAREYAAAEFSPAAADAVVEAMLTMETTLRHDLDYGNIRDVMTSGGWDRLTGETPAIYSIPKVTKPVRYAATLRRVNAQLPAAKRTAWRWRVLYLRVLLDEELQRTGGRPTEASDRYFAELGQIYHADQAEWIVSPVGRKDLTRHRNRLPFPVTPPVTIPARPRWRSPFITTWQASKLQPKTIAAASAKSLADPLGWQPVTAGENPPGFVNIHPLVGEANGIVYLANKFRVTKAGRWILHIGHDGGVRVFVNGRAVLTVPERQNPAPVLRSKVALRLAKGVHEIVIAFDTSHGLGWGIFACFDSTGMRRPVFPKRVQKG